MRVLTSSQTEALGMERTGDIVDGLEGMLTRLRYKPEVARAVAEAVKLPEAYERPDRFVADVVAEGSAKAAQGPGYEPYQREVRVSKSARNLVVRSNRPAHPKMTDAMLSGIARTYAIFAVEGTVPSPRDIVRGA